MCPTEMMQELAISKYLRPFIEQAVFMENVYKNVVELTELDMRSDLDQDADIIFVSGHPERLKKYVLESENLYPIIVDKNLTDEIIYLTHYTFRKLKLVADSDAGENVELIDLPLEIDIYRGKIFGFLKLYKKMYIYGRKRRTSAPYFDSFVDENIVSTIGLSAKVFEDWKKYAINMDVKETIVKIKINNRTPSIWLGLTLRHPDDRVNNLFLSVIISSIFLFAGVLSEALGAPEYLRTLLFSHQR